MSSLVTLKKTITLHVTCTCGAYTYARAAVRAVSTRDGDGCGLGPASYFANPQSACTIIMADAKVPLTWSANGEAVDYDALFNREGDRRRQSERFATKTAIGEVLVCSNYQLFVCLYQQLITYTVV